MSDVRASIIKQSVDAHLIIYRYKQRNVCLTLGTTKKKQHFKRSDGFVFEFKDNLKQH